MHMKKAVIFDLDGTLTDPKEGITKSVQYALNHYGIQVEDLERLIPFIGPPLMDSFQEFYGFSPEQARGGYCDERSDIYSLGITIYEMVTGRVPFDGDTTVAVAIAHINEAMVPPSNIEPSVPVALEQIIFKCTQKRPNQRYSNCADLIKDLRHALVAPNERFVHLFSLRRLQMERLLL